MINIPKCILKHDAKVDFFGRKLATASSDRTIRIFQINDNQTETLLSILSGHEGPVWQIAWAHPKFGAILGSCSYDGTVIIWQEDSKKPSINGVSPSGTHATWNKIKVHKAHESSGKYLTYSFFIYYCFSKFNFIFSAFLWVKPGLCKF